MGNEMLIYIHDYDGEIISNFESDELFGDSENMSYKHFNKHKTYADDLRVLSGIAPKNNTTLSDVEKTKMERN